MLHIRKDQLDAFAQQQRREFVQRLTVYLMETLPDKVYRLSGASLAIRVNRCVDDALALNIESEIDIARFVHVRFDLGDDFEQRLDRQPELRKLLQDAKVSGTQKADALWNGIYDLEYLGD